MKSLKQGIALIAAIVGLCVFISVPTYAGASDKKVALIIALGGLGDRSYNDSGFAGLTKAAQDFGVEVVPIESPDPLGEGEQLLRAAAEAGFDLVITLEYSHFDPLPRVAVDYPDTMFSIINVSNLVLFHDPERYICIIFHQICVLFGCGMEQNNGIMPE